MADFVALDITRKGKTHVLEWKMYGLPGSSPFFWGTPGPDGRVDLRLPPGWANSRGPVPDVLRQVLHVGGAFTVENCLGYALLWRLRGSRPVFVQHQEWDIERPLGDGTVWRRPEAELARITSHVPAVIVPYELTGQVMPERSPLVCRARWQPGRVLLGAPAAWEPLLTELALGSGRDNAVRSTWFYAVRPDCTLEDMARAVTVRGRVENPVWALPGEVEILAYVEYGQDAGYRSAMQFICKNAGARDRVRRAAEAMNALVASLLAAPSAEAAVELITEWVADGGLVEDASRVASEGL